MPSGAKKRKALKKKKQQEAIGTSTNNNGNNLHGKDEHGSQDERESDSNLSSPGSQENEEFGTKDPSAAQSSSLVKGTAKEISGDADVTHGLGQKSGNAVAVEKGTDYQKNLDGKPHNSYTEDSTHTTKNVPCQDACGNSISEIAPPIVDSVKPVVSVSKVVISEKSEHVDVKEKDPSPGLENDNSKVVTLPGSAAETNKKIEIVREPEVPEEKHLLLPGPPAVRTSWLSCCGLFDAMTGSDR